MVEASQFFGLALASTLIIAVPGPSVLFIVGRALTHGRNVAFATVLGNATGSLIAGVLVAVGLGEILARSEMLFHVMKYAGAAYLILLGIQALRAHTPRLSHAQSASPAASSWWRTASQGLVVGVSNPKVFILYAAILPQFVNKGSADITTQMLILAFVPVVIGLLTDMAWAFAASGVRGWFANSPRRMRRIGQAGGISIIGLGVVTAVTGDAQGR